MKNHFDICIIGGGPVGLAVAAGLPQNLRVALVEQSPIAPQLTTAFDGRTIALAPQGVELFQHIGVWPQLAKTGAPIRHIRIADQHSPHILDFHASEVDREYLGMMVENRYLRAALWNAVKARKNVTVFNPASVKSFDLNGNFAQIEIEANKPRSQQAARLASRPLGLLASLVIAADGRTSPSRTQLGTKTFAFQYAQHAIACTITHSNPHNGTALEHFLPEGPFATLPLTGNRSGIVWTIKPDTTRALMALTDVDFVALMQKSGADFLGDIRIATPRVTYPLALQHAHTYTAPHFVLVGDAAHTMHPIAGQGFNMGLRDVECLLNLIPETTARGLRVDDASLLQQYETRRRADNQTMLAATDIIDRAFSNTLPLLTPLRQMGLSIVNALPPLRRFFMQQAMGLAENRKPMTVSQFLSAHG